MTKLRIAAVSAITSVGMVASLSAPVAAHSYGGWQRHNWREDNQSCAQAWRAVKKADRWLDPTIDYQRERFQSAINQVNTLDCEAKGDVVDTLMWSGQFSTLVNAVSAAGLVDTLKGGEFTVFAPTDEAFAKIPADTLQAVVQDKALLTSILTYHVLAGTVDAATAQTVSSATTANGKNVAVSVRDGAVYINDSMVTLYDIPATNGVIHVIDTVLMP